MGGIYVLKRILKAIASLWNKGKNETDRLYYLTGIKPIKANKYVIDEYTVTK
jgi:hypothetical protein